MMKFSLVDNQMTENPNDRMAQTHATGSLDKNALIARILKRGTTLTKTDILAVLNGLEEVIVDALLEGYTINLPLFNTSFSITGVFEGPADVFDPNRHKLHINLTKGVLLREAEKNVTFEKTYSPTPLPTIQEIKDTMTGRVDEALSSNGGPVEVRGYNLRIEGDDPACGLWFVDDDGMEQKATVFIENKPSKIVAVMPSLTAGRNYQVKVVTQFSSGGVLLKTPKTFVFPKKLLSV